MQYSSNDLGNTLEVIGNKWTVLIILSLLEGPKRFNQLQKQTCVCPRTLSIRLQELEQDNIVKKSIDKNVPHKVDYFLTKRGKSLNSIIVEMARWGSVN